MEMQLRELVVLQSQCWAARRHTEQSYVLGRLRKAQGGEQSLHCGIATELARTASKQHSADKSGCCSFLNTCQGPGCYAGRKQLRSTTVLEEALEAACWLPKAHAWCLPIWTGQAGAPGLPLAQRASPQACLCQWSWDWSQAEQGRCSTGVGEPVPCPPRPGLPPAHNKEGDRSGQGKNKAHGSSSKRKRLINTSQPKIMRAGMP